MLGLQLEINDNFLALRQRQRDNVFLIFCVKKTKYLSPLCLNRVATTLICRQRNKQSYLCRYSNIILLHVATVVASAQLQRILCVIF